ncbi:SAM-dependent methyltransferase [Dissulfurispira thermophila]|uniref:SAM-dependent methyltransferase n=1 Tax=Dissulfurispira thermophila TaxID=2715679 RepID=A0A7G1H0U1_9BACT|nr:tRNA1(Val) (adenine(37)-N6)-methyltransferase [Dissulfurispira thermophila]BCB95287.1 SAM-dependent methyltransferase [Dissulfurispira thermophila]
MLTLDSIRDIQIYQNKNGYRFSVDALLIFSFINLTRVKKIADLGTGSGIIGILLAKKYPDAKVALIEIQKSLARLAEKNVALNKLQERVKVIRADLKELSKTHLFTHLPIVPFTDFDLVVSNPPFRKVKTGRLSIGNEKAIARHEIKLSLKDLMNTSSTLLRHHGRLCIIHLPERLTEIIDAMRENNLEPKRMRFIHSNVSTEAKMVLIEAVKGGSPGLKTERPFFIYNENSEFTDEMKDIYNK